MEELINKFLALGSCYGYGNVSGDGDGDGSGSGYGSGDGDGYGSGDGYGNVYGDGYGDGYGSGLSTYNGKKVYMIDDTATLIDSVHSQYARGSIINSDLTLTPCFIARSGDYFAHGETLEDAKRDAEAKALKNESIEQRIERFKTAYPDYDAKVSNAELYKWHNVLTGSCDLGRKRFAREHNIDIENGCMTVREFVELTKNAFGGAVIKQLKEAYNI